MLFVLGAAQASHAAECNPAPISRAAVRLIRPLVALQLKGMRQGFIPAGLSSGLDALLTNRSRAGDEALAYALTVYMGEHFGEQAVCEALDRGKRMVPLLQAYAKCRPDLGLQLPPEMTSVSLVPEVLGQARRGEKCVWGE